MVGVAFICCTFVAKIKCRKLSLKYDNLWMHLTPLQVLERQ